MKEVKFRAWDKENRMMIPVATVNIIWHRIVTIDKEKYILLQYIGLKDKNSKEIYEGDILKLHLTKLPNPNPMEEFSGDEIYVLYRIVLGDDQLNKVANITPDYVEVIGNIYENPELLNYKEE